MKISKIPIATMMTFVSFSFLNAFDTGVYICDTNGLEKQALKLYFGDTTLSREFKSNGRMITSIGSHKTRGYWTDYGDEAIWYEQKGDGDIVEYSIIEENGKYELTSKFGERPCIKQ
jgi:hypothetical protein